MPNSRLHPRAHFLAEVDVLAVGDPLPRRVWGRDLSESGIFLQTTEPLHPGARVSLRFDIDDDEVHVRAAEVVWTRPFQPISVCGDLPGVGLRFLSVDPPARAAIRRYVRELGASDRSEESAEDDGSSLVPWEVLPRAHTSAPPSPPPMPEDLDALALTPLSMPPVSLVEEPEPSSMFSPASLATSPHEAAQGARAAEPASPRASSLAPISLPPFDDVMPAPDGVAAARGEPLRDETQDETKDEAHPLQGWRFEVAHEGPSSPSTGSSASSPRAWALDEDLDPGLDDNVDDDLNNDVDDDLNNDLNNDVDGEAPVLSLGHPTRGAFSGPSLLGGPVEDPERPRERLGLSFDDAPPERIALPPSTARVERAEPVETFSTPPSLLDDDAPALTSADARRRLDVSFFEGEIGVLELPRAEPRRGAKGSGRSRRRLDGQRSGWAAGLLAAGAISGLLAGWGPGAAPETTAPTTEIATPSAHAEPQPVFVAERGLVGDDAPAAENLDAPPPALVPMTSTSASASASEPTRTASAAAPSVPEASSSTPAASPAPAAPPATAAEPPRREEQALTSALPPKERAPTSLRVEWGRVTVPFEGGRVDRTFTLANPPRVVVDLVDARFPGARNDTVGEKGVSRLRIGRPDASHVRVVIELEGDREPEDPSVLKRAGSLAVAWR